MSEFDPAALIRLAEVPQHLPRKNGRLVNLATVHRWALRGIAGRKLRVVVLGGAKHTSLNWLGEFIREVTEARGIATDPNVAAPRSPNKRRTESTAASTRLDRAGW